MTATATRRLEELTIDELKARDAELRDGIDQMTKRNFKDMAEGHRHFYMMQDRRAIRLILADRIAL